MQTLVFLLLLAGAAATIILVPVALLMSGFAFDAPSAGEDIKNYLVVAAMLGSAALSAWCAYQGWRKYQEADFEAALKYAALPVLVALVMLGFVAKAVIETAIEGRRLNERGMHSDSVNAVGQAKQEPS
jgi:hypothetical protein